MNYLELRAEEAECVQMYLDKMNVPTHDKDGEREYSLVGRIQCLVEMSR